MAAEAGESYLSTLSEEALLSFGSMEGLGDRPAVETRLKPRVAAEKRPSAWPGYALAGVVASIAYVINYLPFPPFRTVSDFGVRRPLSAAIIAILAGVAVRNLFPIRSP